MEWAVLMLQKEVGLRLRAKSGTKEYGVLTVLLGCCADVKTLMHLGPGQFHPRPKVDSVVTRIRFHPLPEKAAKLPPYDEKLLRKIVNAGFQKRRKTLVNGLATSPLLSFSKNQIIAVLKKTGLAPDIRPERLTTEDFIALSRELNG